MVRIDEWHSFMPSLSPGIERLALTPIKLVAALLPRPAAANQCFEMPFRCSLFIGFSPHHFIAMSRPLPEIRPPAWLFGLYERFPPRAMTHG